MFDPDSTNALAMSPINLFTNREPGNMILFTLVPSGTGRRLGIDQDLDGILDGDDTLAPPANPAPPPGLTLRVELRGEKLWLVHEAEPGRMYRMLHADDLSSGAWTPMAAQRAADASITNLAPFQVVDRQRFFKIEVLP